MHLNIKHPHSKDLCRSWFAETHARTHARTHTHMKKHTKKPAKQTKKATLASRVTIIFHNDVFGEFEGTSRNSPEDVHCSHVAFARTYAHRHVRACTRTNLFPCTSDGDCLCCFLISASLALSVPLSVFLWLSFSLVRLNLLISLCLSLSVSSVCLSVCLSHRLSLSVCMSLCVCLSFLSSL